MNNTDNNDKLGFRLTWKSLVKVVIHNAMEGVKKQKMRIPKINEVLIKYFNEEIKQNGISQEFTAILSHESIVIPAKYLNDPIFSLDVIRNGANFRILEKIPKEVQNTPEFIDGFSSFISEAFQQIDLQISLIRRSVDLFNSMSVSVTNMLNGKNTYQAESNDNGLKEFERDATLAKQEALDEIMKYIKSDALLLFIELNIK